MFLLYLKLAEVDVRDLSLSLFNEWRGLLLVSKSTNIIPTEVVIVFIYVVDVFVRSIFTRYFDLPPYVFDHFRFLITSPRSWLLTK